jgi:hypothetical protein
MGTYTDGIMGTFLGKVGPVVGLTWKGKNVMRAAPRKRKAPLTKNEKKHRLKFAMVNEFIKGVMDLVNYGYHPEIAHQTGFNKAFSYNFKNAVVMVGDKSEIDYSMVLLSRGDLPRPEALVADTSSPGKIVFSWKDNTGKGQALASDLAFFAFYSEEKKEWMYKTKLAERNQEKYTFEQVAGWTGLSLQTYFGFVSANENESCDSVYLGTVVLKE